MSGAVSLEQLREQLDTFGAEAFLVTVGADGSPHVVSVPVRLEDGDLVATAGGTSRGNATERGVATLLWAGPPDGPYSLIVDGDARVGSTDEVAVHPTKAVLHRLAGASDELPSCVRLEVAG